MGQHWTGTGTTPTGGALQSPANRVGCSDTDGEILELASQPLSSSLEAQWSFYHNFCICTFLSLLMERKSLSPEDGDGRLTSVTSEFSDDDRAGEEAPLDGQLICVRTRGMTEQTPPSPGDPASPPACQPLLCLLFLNRFANHC